MHRLSRAPLLYRLVRGAIRPLLRLYCGLEHPPADTVPAEGPLVVVANHRSYLDAFLLVAAFPRPIAFLTTVEAFRRRADRWLLERAGCIRLRRHSPDPWALRRVLRTLRAGGVVGIFPEGERSWDGGPSPILAGVSRLLNLADAPVLAVRIEGSYRLWPRWGRGPHRSRVRFLWGEPVRPTGGLQTEHWLVDALAAHPGPPSLRRRSASDVGRLIWRCPSCAQPDAVRGRRDGSVFCLRCGARGELLDGTHLDWAGSGPRPLRVWARAVSLSGRERRSLAPPGPDPHRHWPFLRLSDGTAEGPLTPRGKGEAVLTPRALVLRTSRWRAYLPAQSIRSVAVEGSHKLQVATGRRIFELRYRRGSPRGPRAHLEAWLESREIPFRRG
jgi:1-acyl-sn-glycerol-3-phosphate acyltransferase